MAKIDIDGDGKPDITLSIANIITIFVMFASIVGSYYTLSNKIEQMDAQINKVSTNQHDIAFPICVKLNLIYNK